MLKYINNNKNNKISYKNSLNAKNLSNYNKNLDILTTEILNV
jgi:hypothetical protein